MSIPNAALEYRSFYIFDQKSLLLPQNLYWHLAWMDSTFSIVGNEICIAKRKKMPQCLISSYSVASPIGNLIIKVCKQGLHFLSQSDEIVGDTFRPDKSQEVRIIASEDDKSAQEQIAYTVKWLHTYFYEIQSLPDLALPPICTSVGEGTFRGKVWNKLAEHVRPGCTISYGELAKVAGHPGAAQAVGTAMATNPFQIVVPCHRVIRNDGTIGQYARGTRNEVKLWLLEHEGIRDQKRSRNKC